jgi:hypothetical protein
MVPSYNRYNHTLVVSVCAAVGFIQLYFCKIQSINNQIILFLADRLSILKELQMCSLTIWVKAMTMDCWSTMFCGILSYPIWKILKKQKTSRVRLWCDNARGECWENTREACKTRGVEHASRVFSRHSPSALSHYKRTRRVFLFLL